MFSLSKYVKYNYKSVVAAGLLYYQRNVYNNNEFRKYLANCRRNRVSPTVIRTLAKAQFITKASLTSVATILVLRDIYNKFARIRSEMIVSLIPVDKILKVLATNEFFYEVVTDDDNRLRALFFADPRLIALFKDNNYIVIFDYTYKIYASGLLLLYFDIVTRLGLILLLVYVLILDKTFEGYK